MERLTIRSLQKEDIAAIESILRRSPEAAGWLPDIYAGQPAWVAEADGKPVAFLIARTAADEMEILNLAVDPAQRRCGVGSGLLDAALTYGRLAGSRRVFLEVRESNLAARRFYQKHGFTVLGERPGYYGDPTENALLMAVVLSGSE